ncbi:unnamed protein product [Rhizoctonia solani]|uniref:Uncharacterized protein n=1 Tax=Rhizoctonia solani TaxID=456999 RepID=A0A8H3DB31_9AGAM|nr:unnamed protein product [Rhizoctonia solani]
MSPWQQSTSTYAPISSATSLFSSSSTSGTISASSSTPLFSTPQSTSSSISSGPVHFADFAAQAEPSTDSDGSDNHLRTVGIIGGFLAGTALVAIIGIILILLRNQRLRGSSASSSFRSRTRTRSSARPAIPVMSESFTPPLVRPPPPLQMPPGDAMTAMSYDLTTAGTVGHQSTGMHQFPVVGPGSASSRTTSFGQHSSGTSSGGSNVPHRAPQIPSLGLSNPRPFLRSFGSLFSYHASTGHPTPTATQAALERDEQAEQTENTDQTDQTEVTAPSTFGSRTLAATEENVRSDDHTRTEDTRVSEDVTRTAETADNDPANASTDDQPKAS